MKRLIHKAKNHREAHEWDIAQQIRMSPEERQRIANELKRRFYGSRIPDVRSQRLDESAIRKISRDVDSSRKKN